MEIRRGGEEEEKRRRCHLTCSLAFGIELSLLEQQCKGLRVVEELLELGVCVW